MNTGMRIGGAALVTLMAGCADFGVPRDNGAMQREALAGLDKDPPRPQAPPAIESPSTPPTSVIARGTGQFIHPAALKKPRPVVGGKETVTFNFEDQPVEAVVKAILGDLLGENYSIVPGVAGSISFSTSKPVTEDQALPILETLLSWTDNALVREGTRYVVMPAREAIAGNVAPSLGAAKPVHGLQARLFPLRFISAVEMHKLVKPFARPDAVLLADPSRNVLVMAGSASELENYQRTIETFDVDWLRGMSVGVFNLQRANVKELMPTLENLFGNKSGTPVAGLMRFMPIERTNALVVISPQEAYLQKVHEWIERIDQGGGNEPRLFVYDVRNLPVADMAQYLSGLYGGASKPVDQGGRVSPGLTAATTQNTDESSESPATHPRTAAAGGGDSDPDFFAASEKKPAASVPTPSNASGDSVRFTAVEANNQLIVRARPAQWAEIEEVIRRLDAIPLQVQIETRILEVALRNEFAFGVQWFLEGLVGGGQPGNKQQWQLGAALPARETGGFFYSFINNEVQAKVRALETSGDTRTLSSPSLVVVNNQKARIQVGDQIPIVQTFVQTGANAGNQVGQVEYKDTGVILNVKPRVNPGGLVYLQIQQEVSDVKQGPNAANATIGKRQLATQVAVQSGQTVLLGGLIKEGDERTRSGVPFLSRIPWIGNLFGQTSRQDGRTELIVLITPKVIANGEDAKRVADEFRQRFRSLEPVAPPRADGPKAAREA
ncbi:general secretion pathway protein D [Luteibacter sp. Sphag1AF]|uniref:type II secretion system secretin GspD n=1 Tax=Luteibacter sp. Sphag1AF TaxID=2587031 RepID=UPI00160AA310|nr:type II secretion system secretin GspD [Luteibacter sp. Sphag1AF]MBB3227897.1 general secretion pathway protein D [Luteibacter sp. Sphag1AF]